MANKLKTKRVFKSLFASLAVHLLVFITLGFVFLSGKSYEEYVEVTFAAPLPKLKRRLQTKKPVTRLKKVSFSPYENAIKEQIPEVTTVAEISGLSSVYLSPAPFEERNLTVTVPRAVRITIPKTQIQSKVKVPFSKPEIKQRTEIAMTSLSLTLAELKLPSNLNISERIDLDVIKKYREAIKRKIEEEKRYPKWAEENAYDGKVNIRFKLFASGKVEEVEVLKSSGYMILDKEAVRAVTNAAPYPPMPESMKREYIIVEVPIVFRLS